MLTPDSFAVKSKAKASLFWLRNIIPATGNWYSSSMTFQPSGLKLRGKTEGKLVNTASRGYFSEGTNPVSLSDGMIVVSFLSGFEGTKGIWSSETDTT